MGQGPSDNKSWSQREKAKRAQIQKTTRKVKKGDVKGGGGGGGGDTDPTQHGREQKKLGEEN